MAFRAGCKGVNAHAEGAAEHYRKMYARVSALAKIGVWECDLATEQLTWTDAVYDMFDLPRGSPLERSAILSWYRPDSREQMERLRAGAIRDGTGFSLDICIQTPRGNERWIRLTADIEQEEGRSVRIFGTKQDVTLELAAQERMQTLQTELIHVSRVSAMSTMGATLAHELNQPLTAVVSYMAAGRRILGTISAPPDLAECMNEAGSAAMRAGEIIRRLREMTVRGRSSTEMLDIRDVIIQAVALPCAGETSVALSYDLQDAEFVLADRLQVQQVLFNLVRNAVEAASGKPCQIHVSTRRAGDYLEIHVTDDGPGIPSDVLPKVFDSLVTTKARGMGIGLSISRTIVEAHGGRITARNEPGGGASVCFTLPLAAAPSQGAHEHRAIAHTR